MNRHLILAALLASAPCFALSVADYEKARSTSEMKLYMTGVGQGLVWANEGVANEHKVRLFCPPPAMTLMPENFIRITEENISFYRETLKGFNDQMQVELVMLRGLQNTFPCPK